MADIILKKGREKSLLRRHPWVFSGAVSSLEGQAEPGSTVRILSREGDFLARGAYSPQSRMAVRVWSFNPDREIDQDFFRGRLRDAVKYREGLPGAENSTAGRLINAESDGLPGLIVDRYGDFLVCQFLSSGAEFWKKEIVHELSQAAPCAGIYERSDVDVRLKEGLPLASGLLFGHEPPELMEVREGGLKFLVDVRRGHKTGFYLDQKDNRALLADFSRGREVLNCFAYTGAFGIRALKHGAVKVANVESSPEAASLGRKNFELNGLDFNLVENVEGDVFKILRQYRESGRRFDLVILDPPKFADSRKNLISAGRGYKDINLLAFKLLKADGILFTFSCSGAVDEALFQMIVAEAALDANRDVRIIRRLGQAADHPCALNFPEGTYLKGLICSVS